LAEIVAVLKIPEVWLIAIVILTAYSSYWGTYYFAPFATSALGMSIGVGVIIGLGKAWLNPCAAVLVGFFSDKIGISRAVLGLQVFLTLTFFAFGLFPHQPNMLGLVLFNIVLTAFAVYALRGIYYALLEEGGIPLKMTGTATGIVSVIGFTPDIYMPYIGGVFLDSYPEAEGYRYLFFMISALSMIGALAAFTILRRSRARSAPLSANLGGQVQ
jgi:predicted MFS family arabinose efflux permease